jgi:lipase chaperone LimK
VWTDAAKIDGPNTPAAIKSAQGNARLTLALDELRRLETVLLDSKEGLRTLAGSDSAMVTKKADIDRFKVELDKVERDSTMSANDKINAKDALTRNITAAEGEYNNMKTAKETLKMAILNDLQKEGYNTALLQGYSEY